MIAANAAPANRLLAALPGRKEFAANCDRVELGLGKVLYESGARIRYAYFPLGGFVSLVTVLNDGARLEVGLVGNEGMLGTPLILGMNISPQQALVQGSGLALRMSAAVFRHQYRSRLELRKRLNRYVYVLMWQLAQTATCTRHHLVEERLARSLLLTRDRAHSDRFRLTQEIMASMLGVRRVGITQAASSLQARGLIDYRRGDIAILDGSGLEMASCACYRQGMLMHEQTLGRSAASRSRAAACSQLDAAILSARWER